jgi:hypothetical protein
MRTAFLLSAFCCLLFAAGCSSGGSSKPSSSYPVTTFVDPVSEEVPHVTVD